MILNLDYPYIQHDTAYFSMLRLLRYVLSRR
jgi:hypothetical protein